MVIHKRERWPCRSGGLLGDLWEWDEVRRPITSEVLISLRCLGRRDCQRPSEVAQVHSALANPTRNAPKVSNPLETRCRFDKSADDRTVVQGGFPGKIQEGYITMLQNPDTNAI